MTYDYDATGHKVAERTTRTSETGPETLVTTFGYDALGRLTSVTDALGHLTTYDYDEVGNRVAQTDANGHTTRFAFDTRGRQTKRVLPDGAFETRAFDNAGELALRTDFLGRATTYGYDLMGRLTRRTYPDTSAVAFTYTPTGERLTATDARGQTKYAYDTRRRLASLVYPDGRELDYAYDARGARTSLTAKLGASSWTTSTRYDASGRPIEVTDPTGRATSLTYDAAGQRSSLTYPNTTATTYAYDARGRVTSIRAVAAATTEVATFDYTMDGAGRRTRIDEAGGVSRTYGYDAIDRLTSEAVTGALAYSKTFAYDAVGNRLTQVTTGAGADSVAYAYDTRDRLLTENAVSYGYDANGNTTSKSGEATYAWDFAGRLTNVTTTATGVVDHVYDVDGNRVKTTVTPTSGPATVTNMLVDASGGLSHVVAETDAGGVLKALYVRNGDELLAVMRPAGGGTWTTRWVHSDALGSVRAMTDEAGVVVDARGYEAFGTMNVEAGSDPLPYRFAGEPFEATSKLAYHRARWMDARVGRFHGMDPLLGSPMDPATLHPFLYAGGNPAFWTDASGQTFSSVSVSISNIGMSVLSTMAVATPRLFLVSVTAISVVGNLAQMLNDEFSSGGFVTMTPTSLLSKEGIEIAKTVAEVRPMCRSGQCVQGVDILRAKLAELFRGLRTRTVLLQNSSGRGTFEVTDRVKKAVPGTKIWDAHVAVEIEGGQIVDPTIARVFENRRSWTEYIVGFENADDMRVVFFGQ